MNTSTAGPQDIVKAAWSCLQRVNFCNYIIKNLLKISKAGVKTQLKSDMQQHGQQGQRRRSSEVLDAAVRLGKIGCLMKYVTKALPVVPLM